MPTLSPPPMWGGIFCSGLCRVVQCMHCRLEPLPFLYHFKYPFPPQENVPHHPLPLPIVPLPTLHMNWIVPFTILK